MKKINQKGFTLVEGLLLIIAVSLVVGVGFYVSNANKDVAKVVATSANSPATTKAPAHKFLEIKELGIKVPISGPLSTATYVMSPSDNNYAAISTPAFTKVVNECASKDSASGSTPALGVVSKYPGMYDSAAMPSNFYNVFIKQLAGSYLEYGHADGGLCNGTDSAKKQAAKNLFDKLDPQLKAAVKQAEAL